MKILNSLFLLTSLVSCQSINSPRVNSQNCIECDASNVGDVFTLNGVEYLVVDKSNLEYKLSLGEDITNVCTSKITDMSELTKDKFGVWPLPIQGDISRWDVSNVTDMNNMFIAQSDFNQDISDWDVSNVTDMHQMFRFATSFNQDIGDWDVSKVTDMFEMFFYANNFNQDIGDWNVRKVTNMNIMFAFAYNFNQDIGDWNVRRVRYMNNMFSAAYQFNQDLTGWCVSSFSGIPYEFSNSSALSAANHPLWGTCP